MIVSFVYTMSLEIKIATNNTRGVRSLSLMEVQGPVFIQRGGEMRNVFRQERKGVPLPYGK